MSGQTTIHACAVAVGEACVLLRGRSGAGKSAAALAMIEIARMRGAFARLVADDRVRLEARGRRLIAAPHPLIAGLVERRGQGVGEVRHIPRAVVVLVVDIPESGNNPPRMPEPDALAAVIEGIEVPRLVVAGAPIEIASAALDRLRRLRAGR